MLAAEVTWRVLGESAIYAAAVTIAVGTIWGAISRQRRAIHLAATKVIDDRLDERMAAIVKAAIVPIETTAAVVEERTRELAPNGGESMKDQLGLMKDQLGLMQAQTVHNGEQVHNLRYTLAKHLAQSATRDDRIWEVFAEMGIEERRRPTSPPAAQLPEVTDE